MKKNETCALERVQEVRIKETKAKMSFNSDFAGYRKVDIPLLGRVFCER